MYRIEYSPPWLHLEEQTYSLRAECIVFIYLPCNSIHHPISLVKNDCFIHRNGVNYVTHKSASSVALLECFFYLHLLTSCSNTHVPWHPTQYWFITIHQRLRKIKTKLFIYCILSKMEQREVNNAYTIFNDSVTADLLPFCNVIFKNHFSTMWMLRSF